MTDSALIGLNVINSCDATVVDQGCWTDDHKTGVPQVAAQLQEGLTSFMHSTGLYQGAEYAGARALQPVPQTEDVESTPSAQRADLGKGERIGLVLAGLGFTAMTIFILLNALPLALLGMMLGAVGSSVYFLSHMKNQGGSKWEPLQETTEEEVVPARPRATLELNNAERAGLYVASAGYMVMTVCILLNALPLALLGMMAGAAGACGYFLAHMNKQKAQRAASGLEVTSPEPVRVTDWDRVERIGLNLASVGYSIMAVCILLNALPVALLGMLLGAGGACAYCVARVKKQGQEPADLCTEPTEELEALCES